MMRKGFTLIEMLVVIGILAVLVGLLLPAIFKVREAASLAKSIHNIKQIGLALHAAADSHDGIIPAPYGVANGNSGNALVELLPYLEQESLYQALRRATVSASERMPCRSYINPLDPSTLARNQNLADFGLPQSTVGVSSYAFNAQFFYSDPRLSSIQDGLSNTIWVSEHYGWNCNGTAFLFAVDWISSTNGYCPLAIPTFAQAGPTVGLFQRGDYYPITSGDPPVSSAADNVSFQVRPSITDCDPRLPNASSSRGLQVGVADGSVRILAPSTSPHVFWGAVTPAGGEVLDTW